MLFYRQGTYKVQSDLRSLVTAQFLDDPTCRQLGHAVFTEPLNILTLLYCGKTIGECIFPGHRNLPGLDCSLC
jgi:hypothetical protein